MSPRPLKSLRPAAAALVVFALTTLTLALPLPADAATRCKGGAKIWVVNGRKTCLKTVSVKSGHSAREIPARLQRWFSAATTPHEGGKVLVPKKLRAAAPKAAAAVAKLIADAKWSKKSRFAPEGMHALAAGAASAGAVVETMSQDGPNLTLPSGVKLSSHLTGRAYEDGSQRFDVDVDATYKGVTVRYKPDMDAQINVIPAVTCPTSSGLLKIDHTTAIGGTMMVLKGNNVLAAVTERHTDTTHARGHVGRDARLHDVDVDVVAKLEHYERGLQMVTQTSGSFDIPREGEPVASGPLSSDVNIRAAGASRSQERDAEKRYAAGLAADSGEMKSLGAQAEVARWRMMQDEYKWYSLPGRCASIRYNPDTIADLAAGKSTQVEGRVESDVDHGVASGEFSVAGVSRGSFTVSKPQSDPGAPAQFRATGASPDSDKITVASDVIATSTAGRAQGGWYAQDDLDLPKKVSGTISASSTMPGGSSYFHSWVVYTLDEVYVSDSGFISAWYKLTTADQDEVQQEIGSGCRWVAKGSGGNIEAGDIELNKAPGGEWQHAVMYDVEIPDATYTPTDCGESPPPAFTGDLVGFVNMAMLGGGFEGVGENFHMEGLRVHTDSATQRKTVASWAFDPGDPQ